MPPPLAPTPPTVERIAPAALSAMQGGLLPIPLPWELPLPRQRAAILALWLATLVLCVAPLYALRPVSGLITAEIVRSLGWVLPVLWGIYGGGRYAVGLAAAVGIASLGAAVAPMWLTPLVSTALSISVLFGFRFDPQLRRWRALGTFLLAMFCGAVMHSLFERPFHGIGGAQTWELRWVVSLLSGLALGLPVLHLAGPTLEALKERTLPGLRRRPWSLHHQILGLGAIGAGLVLFCVAWLLAADAHFSADIDTAIGHERIEAVLNAQRAAALRIGILLAILIGGVCGAVALAVLMLRRHDEELQGLQREIDDEALYWTGQLALLQSITEHAAQAEDAASLHRGALEQLVARTQAAGGAVFLPAPHATATLESVAEHTVRKTRQQLRATVPSEDSLVGASFHSATVVSAGMDLEQHASDDLANGAAGGPVLESLVAFPLVAERDVYGVIALIFDAPFVCDESTARHFRVIGHVLGGALERMETLRKSRQYAADLSGLYRFSQQLALENTEEKIAAVAVPAALRLLGANATAVYVLEKSAENARLRCLSASRVLGDSAWTPPPLPLTEVCAVADAVRDQRSRHTGRQASGSSAESAPMLLTPDWSAPAGIIVPFPPLPGETVAAGALAVAFDNGRVLGLEELGLAEEVARQTFAALRQARLIRTTAQQAAELRLLEQISRALSQRMTMSHALKEAVVNVTKVVPAKWGSVFVVDSDTQSLRTRETTVPHADAINVAIPLNATSLVVTCLKEGRSLVSPDMTQDPRCNPELNRKFGTRSAITVPLGPPGQRFGVLMVNNPHHHDFSADDVRLVEQVGQLTTAALERARLYEEACERADELILLNEIGHFVVEGSQLPVMLQRTAALVCRNLNVSGAVFFLLSDDNAQLICAGSASEAARAPEPIPTAGDSLILQCVRGARPMLVEDVGTQALAAQLGAPQAASAVLVPLLQGEKASGVLAAWRLREHRFTHRDQQRLMRVARLAAAAAAREALSQALRASEARLKELVDGIHALIISVDRSGIILSFNAAAERASGLGGDEAIGRSFARIMASTPHDRAQLEQFISGAFRESDTNRELIVHWVNKDGRERKIRWTCSFLRGGDGNPTGMVCLGQDITEQQMLEQQLRQAQKMESVGALAGGMAHDFNNLLGGILGQCALARAQFTDGHLHELLGRIESASHRGADLTAKLMAFARKSVLQPRAVDIGALLSETAGLLTGSVPRSIRIATEAAGNLPPVFGDPTQLQQVLLNLCVNARDAMKANGGTLTLTAGRWQPDPETTPPDACRPGVELQVRDTGTGMSEDVQQHLFEPFFTTKEPGKGTGLGLSVVFGIVRSHGGTITVQSEPGKGTCFTLRLPGMPDTAQSNKTTPVYASGSGSKLPAVGGPAHAPIHDLRGVEQVLLIDDDAMLRETVRQLLESIGYHVRAADGGSAALKMLDETKWQPRVILLDVVMPGLAGLPLFRALRERLPQTPVLLVSGYSTDTAARELIDAGAAGMVPKPFTLDVLAMAIRRTLQPQTTS